MLSLLEEDPFELADAFSYEESQVDPAQSHQYGDYRRWLDLPREVPVIQFGTIEYCKECYDRYKKENARYRSKKLRPPLETALQ